MANYPFNPIPWHSAPHDFAGDSNLGIYQNEATQRYVPGTRFLRWDGSVFKYGKNKSGGMLAARGAGNWSGVVNIADNLPNIVVGDRTTMLTVESGEGVGSDGVVLDKELVGGYLVVGHAGTPVMNRLIIDTEGIGTTGVGGEIKLTFDGPFSDALTAPWTEVNPNPYRYLAQGLEDHDYQGVMGVTACVVTATFWCWIQSWGPCWITPGGDDNVPGNSADDRSVYFVGDGSVNGGTYISPLHRGHQLAGFIIDMTESAQGALPLVMIQISI